MTGGIYSHGPTWEDDTQPCLDTRPDESFVHDERRDELAPTLLANGHGGGRTDRIPVAVDGGEELMIEPYSDARLYGNGTKAETDAGAILWRLREQAGAEAFQEWGLRVVVSLQQETLLRSGMHEGGISGEASQAQPRGWSLPRSTDEASWLLRTLRGAERAGCTPPGPQSVEQFARELGAALSSLPLLGAQPVAFLYALRSASQGLRLLLEALSAIQAVGRPSSNEAEPVHAGKVRLKGGSGSSCVRRLTPT